MPPTELVTALRAALGVRLVGVIAGVKETRAVHQWADGVREVRDPLVLDRLRLTYRVVRTLDVQESHQIVQAWMQGLNPILGEQSPARLLREGDLELDGPRVLDAARAFAAVA